jgi:hypothetical protein
MTEDKKADLRLIATDPFDPDALRLDQTFIAGGGVRKLLLTVPVRRPSRQDFVRTHPDPAYRLTTALVELRDERESYLVPPHMAEELVGEFSPCCLYTTINRQGVVHLWPVKLPGPDGRIIDWHRSAAEAAERAMSRWIRVAPNMALRAYEIFEALGTIPEPEWPDVSLRDLLGIAFRDRLVDRPDHPLIHRLRGV